VENIKKSYNFIKMGKLKKGKCRFLKGIRAFSLIEVLIVIVLIAILSTAVMMALMSQLRKGRDARRKADLHTLKNKIEVYYYAEKRYPEELPICGQPLTMGGAALVENMPCDPQLKTPYTYIVSETGNWFKIYTNLEHLPDPVIDELGCRGGCGPDCAYNYGVTSPNRDLRRCVVYVCAPGGGSEGNCELYDDPIKSKCPIIYGFDLTCEEACSNRDNRCENASGKQVPGSGEE